MRNRAFRRFTTEDLWDVYEADNPLLEIFRKIARSATTGGNPVATEGAAGDSEMRPRLAPQDWQPL